MLKKTLQGRLQKAESSAPVRHFLDLEFSTAIIALIVSYFCLRLLFQQIALLKLGFIFPTGSLVNGFYQSGLFDGRAWQFYLDRTHFTLAESCSGTTFFSLLAAYFVYQQRQLFPESGWPRLMLRSLLLAYPVAIIANAIRVVSSIEAHRLLVTIDQISVTDQVHTLVGSMVFLAVFLLCAIGIDLKHVSEASA